MVDETRAPIEDEAPVNPYSLLAAVNDSSKDAHMAWLIFLGLMSYLILAVAGVSHKDLLLNSDVPLPILQVKIELTRFFPGFAAILQGQPCRFSDCRHLVEPDCAILSAVAEDRLGRDRWQRYHDLVAEVAAGVR